ncbi:MAG: hypothetical protein ACI9YH_000927 [Colwellia sp.]|jgi:hypothetical protein
MESSFKDKVNEYQQTPDELNRDVGANTSHDSLPSREELSQLELMKQWRCNLEHLREELGIPACNSITAGELKDITPDITEKLDYLKKTDELLQQHDDFALSEAGFNKYKNAHLLVVNFLTQVYQQKKEQEEVGPVKFYFFSRAKHIKQQSKTIPWLFAFFHLILLIITSLVLLAGTAIIAVLTQNNGIVWALLFLTFLNFFLIAKNKIKKYKVTAFTPVRFIISLLSICSLTVVLYALFFIAIPSLIAWEVKPYWRDDILIISLALFSFILFGHSHEESEASTSLNDSENTKVETVDAVKFADAEVIK